MSKRIKNTASRKVWRAGCFSGRWSKQSNNAKHNQRLNQGITAAQGFYLRFNY